jgi:hypothetical protein
MILERRPRRATGIAADEIVFNVGMTGSCIRDACHRVVQREVIERSESRTRLASTPERWSSERSG